MKYKIKAIIKRPDEEIGHMTNISPSLENLQKTVGGYIETVPITEKVMLLCDGEGKLKNREPNIWIGQELIVGTVIILGVKGEEFDDIPINFQTWKELMKKGIIRRAITS